MNQAQAKPQNRVFSIANQLRYGLVSIVAFSMLLAGGALIYLSFQAQLAQTKRLQQEQSQAAASQIGTYLDGVQRQLNYLSELRGLTEFAKSDRRSILDGLVNSNSAYEMVGILNSQGQIVEVLSPYKALSLSSVKTFGTSGTNSPLFVQTFRDSNNYVSPVEIDSETRLPVATLAVPIRNQQNRIDGVLFAKINLSFLSQIVSRTEVGKTGYTYVLDDRLMLIAQKGSDPKSFQLQDLKDRVFIQNLSKLALSLEPQQSWTYKGLLSQQVLGAATLVRRVHWTVVVELPTTEVYAPVRQMIVVMGGATLACIVVALGVGFAFSRSITLPLQRLTSAAAKIRDGDLNSQVDIQLGNELGLLAGAFNQMAKQLQQSFETLEDKVKERTAELATANAEISALNERLKSDNLHMSAQLDILREMQQLILPKTEELAAIEDLDIAGFMEPADEVGGDYYDVLHADGVVTIGIGDVTGHGLESGILMVMAQTAVRTLQEIQEADPVRFLDTLNRTLYKNVQRMNSDKNLTLAILNYAEGRISISGQHEETIVVRKGGQIERIDTIDLGFPIGLDNDIADLISHTTVELQPGDGIVLYTDGIPEAEDINKEFYGLERLCSVISINWHKSAEQIKQAVIDDLQQFIGEQKVFDDITLVVLKRKDKEMVEIEERSLVSAQL
jgi:phosphoserine phosphatase RsbU/P